MERTKNFLLATIPFLAILIIWQVSSYFHFFPKWLIASPLDVFLRVIFLIKSGVLGSMVLTSLLNMLPPFILAIIAALVAGIFIGSKKSRQKIFTPFLSALYPVPSLAWLPLIILILGFTRESIWVIVFMSTFLRMVYNVISGVQSINVNWILLGENLGVSRMSMIFKIMLPASLPYLVGAIRIGFGSAWRSLISAEMIVEVFGGLGKFIWMAQWYFDFEAVIAGILVISVIGFLAEKIIFRKIEEKLLIKWGMMN